MPHTPRLKIKIYTRDFYKSINHAYQAKFLQIAHFHQKQYKCQNTDTYTSLIDLIFYDNN